MRRAVLALGAALVASTLTHRSVAEPAAAAKPVYAWGPRASAQDRLDVRFASPPRGFARVAVDEGSFAAMLRGLPLQPDGAPVVDYRGGLLYEQGTHPNIAAVADLDVGTRDLQHCADAVIRLHAEWRYGRGDRALAYRALSGATLSYVEWRASKRRADDHPAFRAWLDDVFAWANTASLERDAAKVPLAAVRGGDFFVISGAPFGHAVLVLDVAKADDGRVALLLGQSYMPAQSFHVLRPSKDSAWFVVEKDAASVATPFWKPFPASALRRLPGRSP